MAYKADTEKEAKRRRELWWITSVAVVAIILAVVAIIFWVNPKRSATIDLSRQLAVQSKIEFEEFNYELALLLAIEAGKAGRIVETDTLEVFDVLHQTFVRPGRTKFILAHGGSVYQVQWNGDKSLILTSSMDGAVQVWDAQTGEERFRLEHEAAVTQAQWNQDESLLMVAAGNTVWQYYTRMEDLLAAACERAPRNMTQAEWRRFFGEKEYRVTCENLPPHPSVGG